MPGTGKQRKPSFKESTLDIRLPAGFGVSLIDDTPRELLYLSARGIRLRYVQQCHVLTRDTE